MWLERETTEQLVERFWSQVQLPDDPLNDCWLWQGPCGSSFNEFPVGHGTFQYDGKTRGAHRVAYLLAVGPIPDGLWVLHECDNPQCVSPNHLFLGTAADNAQDRMRKGRLHPRRDAKFKEAP